jgi:hypothetical protein
MEAVIAGWIAGDAMALVMTAAFTFLLVRAEDLRFARAVMPEKLPPLLTAVPVLVGMGFAWTFLGLLLGAGFAAFGPEDAAGLVPSVPFLLAIVAVGLAPLPFLLIFWGGRWWLWSALAASFIGLFGVLMPALATV